MKSTVSELRLWLEKSQENLWDGVFFCEITVKSVKKIDVRKLSRGQLSGRIFSFSGFFGLLSLNFRRT
jgi:hypothetical protein